MSANLNQQTTSIGSRLSPDQTVTVIDPRHPLCGRTLPLIGITNKPYLGRCCVVWLHPEVERLVPVSATDLGFDPDSLSSIPLSIEAVKQLLHVFEVINHASRETHSDGPYVQPASVGRSDSSQSALERADANSTAASAPNNCGDLPAVVSSRHT